MSFKIFTKKSKTEIVANIELDYTKIDKEYKIEYISALISNLDSQKKYNLLFITFDLVVIAFIIDKISLNDKLPADLLMYKPYFLINIIFYLLSAGFFTIWMAKIHWLTIKVTDLFISLNIDEARHMHYPMNEYFKRWGWISILAATFLVCGLLMTITVLLYCNNFL